MNETPKSDLRLYPNMLIKNETVTSSTFSKVDFDHCIVDSSKYTNSLIKGTDLRFMSIYDSTFEGCYFDRCSLKGAKFSNCNVDGLVINGINIGNLLKFLGENK